MQNHSTVLEVKNLTFTGQIDPSSSCLQNCCICSSSDQFGLILNDISFTLRSGDFCLILGSKGSGKKVLLNTIAQLYSKSSIRGRILLNHLPLKQNQFNTYCSYVQNDQKFLKIYNGLRVNQILSIGLKISQIANWKSIFLQDVYSDFVLNHLTNRFYEHLSESEQKRVLIAFEFLKNPIVLLLDEVTSNCDPLNTYLTVSILANLSKKYGTIIISTMDRPRSDIFPFIDHVIYLCLGDIVYSGSTRSMLDYFHSIGFPCPEFENPLMYYLCLCTVDRRSRERFLESNHQMSLLIEKFKLAQVNNYFSQVDFDHTDYEWKQMPSTCTIILSLYKRFFLMTFQCNNRRSLIQLFWQIFVIPFVYMVLWSMYKDAKKFQHSFLTRTGFIISVITLTSLIAILNCIFTYHKFHRQFVYEKMNGLYNGCTFLIAYNLFLIPLSLLTVISGSVFVYLPFTNGTHTWDNFMMIAISLWIYYMTNIQQTILIKNCLKSHHRSRLVCIASVFNLVSVIASSGMLHAFKSLNQWAYYLSFIFSTRYLSVILGRHLFISETAYKSATSLPYLTTDNRIVESHCGNHSEYFSTNSYDYCVSSSDLSYFEERYVINDPSPIDKSLLETYQFNILFMFCILSILMLCNLFVSRFLKS